MYLMGPWEIQTIKEKVDKEKEFLDNYFLRIKQNSIAFLINQINQIESSYELSFQSFLLPIHM